MRKDIIMSAPASIVEQHLKHLTDNKIALDTKFSTTCEIVKKLGEGDQKKNIISIANKLTMYGWYKIALGEPLKDKPSVWDTQAYVKWAEHNKLLNEDKLTAEACKHKYIQFIIDVLKKYSHEVAEILEPKKPKKTGLFAFGRAKPAEAKAAAETATSKGNTPVLLSTAG